jgi:hypothetical protein
MKYLINRMQCNIFSQQVRWLDGKVFASNPKVKGSNLMGCVMCGQQWYVDQIFSYQIFRIGA